MGLLKRACEWKTASSGHGDMGTARPGLAARARVFRETSGGMDVARRGLAARARAFHKEPSGENERS
jgi:hypothetical protein